MMERFLEQYNDWTKSHHETWISKRIPGPDWLGAGVSAQLDLMSPTSLYDFTRNPTQFNLAKVAYGPLIGGAGYSWVSAITGAQIGFAHRVAHSAEMSLHTAKAVGTTVGKNLRTIGWGAFAAAALVGTGLYLQHLYHDLSGMHIGDIRFNR